MNPFFGITIVEILYKNLTILFFKFFCQNIQKNYKFKVVLFLQQTVHFKKNGFFVWMLCILQQEKKKIKNYGKKFGVEVTTRSKKIKKFIFIFIFNFFIKCLFVFVNRHDSIKKKFFIPPPRDKEKKNRKLELELLAQHTSQDQVNIWKFFYFYFLLFILYFYLRLEGRENLGGKRKGREKKLMIKNSGEK
ncbi:hypothetical protein RFI_18023 [Reticulomyxa filosa]|uniref:Transmembrane protein n=1 Tax=Reticulomyxa filosa TaxID=46433 RepID=X6MZY2_RETFI|nr:hypothetical protein RFI_18023 [Reticulomyxa filosa]|eukprot:ETO19208.1 hypothetical protein RFI_18023 [Reticulomyxa filosa]